MTQSMNIPVTFCFLCCTLLLAGCTTKSKAQLQAQQAFIAGQQEAIGGLRQLTANTVYVSGDVQNPNIPWRDGLSLVNAIVMAQYRGFRDPQEIMIVRDGRTISVNPKALLKGEDEPLQPGDRIILR